MSSEPSFITHLHSRLVGGGVVTKAPDQGALAPFAIFDAPNGFGEETWSDAQPESVISLRISGSEVISHVPAAKGRVVTAVHHAVTLQPQGGCNHYFAANKVRFAHFYISDGLLSRVADGLGLTGFGHGSLRPDLVAIDDPDLYRLVMSYGERAVDQHAPPSRIELEARALLVMDRLIGRYHLGRSAAGPRGGLAPWQLKRAQETMEAHLDSDLALDDLAKIAGCSPTHFSRAFKQSVGVAPFHWLNEKRIERAKALLADPSISLAEVALAVGFAAQPQFTTAFGRATGLTPGAWRRERLCLK